ncbi:phosphoribosylpyrophosphate synthetase [Tenacibaculum singaporense]|uniref:Phosphoribosylpyrophosphate synthetase n=1 Tax=Tenacibaculum singaporense TaxID=2358479 RepID=A0A3S8R8F5_9FLAO|nr:phosphoribosylpyrophosphate synthetase [Tenacibaculum singaporense]AZJ36089.1 phosphoribosylpyrophosphate synthetase [Tenacibaculum singaporense]
MYTYDTLSEALKDLHKRGFTLDFNLKENEIESKNTKEFFSPDFFEVVEVHRFEGMSSTGDNSVVYAIQTKTGVKGVLVDAYGVYADSLSSEMIQKLKIVR